MARPLLSLHRRVRGPLLVLAACLALPVAAGAQVIHIPTAYRRILPPGTKVLTITAANGARDASILIDEDRLVIQRGDGALTVVTLANREVRDVMNQIVSDLGKDVTVVSDYPLLPAAMLGNTPRKKLDAAYEITASPDDPELRLGFGVVMSLANPKASEQSSGILTQTGFQLDVVGSHQIIGPGTPPSAGKVSRRPHLYAQVRLGLNADQQIQVGKEEGAVGDQTSAQFEDALQQADQIAASGQTDLIFPMNTRFDWVLTPSYAVSWTRPSDIPLPEVRVGAEFKPAADVFTADAIERTRLDHRRTFPLSELGVLATAQFRRRNTPAFYAGGGVMRREIIVRGVRYERQPPAAGAPAGTQPGDPVPGSLRAIMRTDALDVWRVALGARLAGVLDVRLDASGPFDRTKADPLLRLLIARAFPILQ